MARASYAASLAREGKNAPTVDVSVDAHERPARTRKAASKVKT